LHHYCNNASPVLNFPKHFHLLLGIAVAVSVRSLHQVAILLAICEPMVTLAEQ
jgi:hypothetical protein